ncbi:DUF4194 domain-containing protein [Pectobacterium carotovorum]|uniref:DUF4194 domain-containing protein n=1 Tax=Pectobacterium carotovorum TaxID=554 RepID=UPI002085C9A0|nr:DUF4194 domain-containing protein [Pectobacterium carotovorum]MDY4374516.1 DUF4194 domain-containing protein [Pectobacterium carotovorum subsp. carotovorum]GKW38751.1 hypothetical protein PEC301875_27750 [Pectobacterium carotovorum subsp. carotovorum]
MTNNTPPNSFFSMVTGKSDQELHTEVNEGNSERSDDPHNLDSPFPKVPNRDFEDQSFQSDGSGLLTESVKFSDSDMPHDVRRVLVHLMRQGSVMSSQKPKLFEQLCRYELAIRKHLSEVYLQLVLDQKSGVAFVASKTSEHAGNIADDGLEDEASDSDESATLIPKRTLSLFDTLILLVLRKHYQDRESAGEQKITIDIERLESYMTPFLPITDHASKDRKKLLIRVKEMVKRKVLSTIRGEEDRYEITPIIRYVVNASFLETMLTEYTALAQEQLNETGRARSDQK